MRVVCFGNAWHGDDGFGLAVLAALRDGGGLPAGVPAVDAGTAGLAALPYFEGARKVVLVDALRTGGRAGDVRRLELGGGAPGPGDELSMHGLGVEQLLAALPAALDEAARPALVLVGAEVAEVRLWSRGLSPAVAGAVGRAVELVVDECTSSA